MRKTITPMIEQPSFSVDIYPNDFTGDPSASISIPSDLLAVGAAKAAFRVAEGRKIADKLVKTRFQELSDIVKKSRYPYAMLPLDPFSMDLFIALYGYFLSPESSDQKESLRFLARNFEIKDVFESLTPNMGFNPKLPAAKKDSPVSLIVALYIMDRLKEPSFYIDNFDTQIDLAINIMIDLTPIIGIDFKDIKLGKTPFFPLVKKALRRMRGDIKAFPVKPLELFCIVLDFCVPVKTNKVKGVEELLPIMPSTNESFAEANVVFSDLCDAIISKDKTLSATMLRQTLQEEFKLFVFTRVSELQIMNKSFLEDEDDEDEQNEDKVLSDLKNQLSSMKSENVRLNTKINDLLAQQSDLQLQVRRSQGEAARLQEELESYKAQLDSVQSLEADDAAESTDTIEPITEEDLATLRRLRVVICGGHERMHRHFMLDSMPWEFVDAHGFIDKKVLESADFILVISKYISHASFFYVRSVGEKNPDIGKKTFFCSFKNKELVYHQLLDFLKQKS